jgi:hypothetical protein
MTVARVVPLEPDDELRSARRSRTPFGRVLRVATHPVASVWLRPTVDEWGRDAGLVGALAPLAHLRWDVTLGGEHHLGAGGALIVVNTRRMALTQLSTALAIGESIGRPVRFAGRPDTVPFGPMMRRIGGVLARPDEIRGALRAGELVLIGARATTNPRHAGPVDHELVAAAVHERVPVHVAASVTTMLDRVARVEVGPALQTERVRRGPLAELELAELAQRRLQDLLDEMGGGRSGLHLFGEG